MSIVSDDIAARLVETNPEFREAYEAHRLFEKKIAKMSKNPHPTPEAEEECHKLKRLKLAEKDKMEAILKSIEK